MNLKEFLGLCLHKWKIIDQWEFCWSNNKPDKARGNIYILQCEHCGKLKKERMGS